MTTRNPMTPKEIPKVPTVDTYPKTRPPIDLPPANGINGPTLPPGCGPLCLKEAPMTRTTRFPLTGALTPLLLLTLAAQPALAEDYPYSGIYWPSFGGLDPTNLDRRCALTFLDQRADGTWAVYHADLDQLKASGEVRYLKLSEGECAFTPETKVEACLVRLDHSYPEGAGAVFYDVVLGQTEDYIETVMIEAASGWETAMQEAGTSDAGTTMNYLRCPFPAEAMLSRISPDATTLSAEALNELRFPSDELVASPEVAQLVQVLRGE